ncbi:unknown [Bacteroides sp. CAG:754]|nr:unknown [Bacteroides sp. CAG:754]
MACHKQGSARKLLLTLANYRKGITISSGNSYLCVYDSLRQRNYVQEPVKLAYHFVSTPVLLRYTTDHIGGMRRKQRGKLRD